MGRFRAIVTRVGITTIAVVSAGTIALAITHAVADSGSNESEEAIRTAPETFPNLSAVPAQTSAPTARAETVATQTPVPILPLEAAESSAKAMRQWAEPKLAQASQMAVRYQPTVDVRTSRNAEGQTQTKIAFALGPNPVEAAANTIKRKIGYQADSRRTYGDRGHWYVYAATNNDAVGFNMLQGMHGEVRRAGFTSERVAAIGDRQAGVAWRKGSLQASLGYVERELSTFGASLEQRFVALTISFKGWGRPVTPPRQRVSPYAPYTMDGPPEERDPRLRR